MDAQIQKLNPSRFPGMSPFVAAVVGYVLGESYTTPDIAANGGNRMAGPDPTGR